MAPDQPPDSAAPKRTPTTPANRQSLLEQRIQQAIENGMFDKLPGAGKPLQLDDDSLVPEEERLGQHLLKANGFTLPWIEARRDIEREHEQLAEWLADAKQRWPSLSAAGRAAMKISYRRKLDDLQRLILNFNLKVPRGIAQIETLNMPAELLKLGA